MASELNTDWYSYPTNYSNGSSINGSSDMFVKYPSFIMNDTFAAGIVLLVWIMTFAISLVVGTRKALAVSSFITLILAIYLMKYLNPFILIGLVALTIIGIIGSKNEVGY